MQYQELFRGSLSTVILKLLSEHGKMYGYEITKRARELSDGEIAIKEGSLYPALHKLEKEGVIISSHEQVGGRTRKYYALTEKGTALVPQKLKEFTEFVETVSKILFPKIITS